MEPKLRASAARASDFPEQAGLHLTRVCCVSSTGAAVTMFDGTGGEYDRHARTRTARQFWARVERTIPWSGSRTLSIALLQDVARGERMDLVMQKAH